MTSQDSQPFHWHYADLDDRDFQIRGKTLFFVVVLFSILLLVTLLVLYARWICRYHPSSAPTTSAANVAHSPPPPQPRGLDQDSINSLAIILYRPSGNESAECAICLGIFVDRDKVKVLPNCGHCYHSECVDSWLTNQSSCPLCRAPIRADSVV